MPHSYNYLNSSAGYLLRKRVPPNISATRKRTRKMKKRILATPAAAIEIPVKPNIAATIATIKNMRAHFSITLVFYLLRKKACHYSFLNGRMINLIALPKLK